jgi:SAM-dependent methyltransferase
MASCTDKPDQRHPEPTQPSNPEADCPACAQDAGQEPLPELRGEFSHLFAAHALQQLLDNFNFTSVLDIGCGSGNHSDIFLNYGKDVTAIDYGHSDYFEKNRSVVKTLIGDFNTFIFDRQFDCVWCSHILEHQPNPNLFLQKVFSLLPEGGVLALTVPPFKPEIVGGHVSFWNAGLVLYHLVLAGFNCREASVLEYGYNISVLLRKTSVRLPSLAFDRGDIRRLKAFLPAELRYHSNEGDDPFDGNIRRLHWTWNQHQFEQNQEKYEARLIQQAEKSLPGISSKETLTHTSDRVFFVGWSDPEPAHRWSIGQSVKIVFRLDAAETTRLVGALLLQIGSFGKQRVTISLNSSKIYETCLAGEIENPKIAFNPSLVKAGVNVLRFDVPDACRPGNGDERIVALAIRSFSLQ